MASHAALQVSAQQNLQLAQTTTMPTATTTEDELFESSSLDEEMKKFASSPARNLRNSPSRRAAAAAKQRRCGRVRALARPCDAGRPVGQRRRAGALSAGGHGA